MAIREGLLALLIGEPKYGYQLKIEFEAATGEAWPLNQGQVYSTLQRLERDGLIEAVGTDGEGRISYRLTLGGQSELVEWMRTPEQRAVPSRDEVAMRVLLAAVRPEVVSPLEVVDGQRQATMRNLQDYTRLRSETDESELAWLMQLDRLILLRQAELRWLDRVEERLAAVAKVDPLASTTGMSQKAGPAAGGREQNPTEQVAT